jgi:hypothetical protein
MFLAGPDRLLLAASSSGPWLLALARCMQRILRFALGPDALEQHGRRLVVGVLINQLPVERPFEDGLAEAGRAPDRGVRVQTTPPCYRQQAVVRMRLSRCTRLGPVFTASST